MDTENHFSQKYQDRVQPPVAFINNCQLLLALETVTQLKNSPAVEIDLTSISKEINLIDKQDFLSVFQGFEEKKKSLESQMLPEQIHLYRIELEKFYTKIIVRELNKLGQNLEQTIIEYLQKSLQKDLQQASPEKLIFFLEDLVETIFHFREKSEDYRIENLDSYESASRAFENLNSSGEEAEYIYKAIIVMYDSRLQKDVFSIYSQIYFKLIQLCQWYCELSRRSLAILETVELSIKNKRGLNFKKVLDPIHQRNLIQLWIGHSINYWGNAPVSPQQLEAKLLQNLEESAREFAKEMYSDIN